MAGTKTCSTCRLVKPFADFYYNREKRDGRHSMCRICAKAYRAAAWKDPTHPAHAALARNAKKSRDIAKTYGTAPYWQHRELYWRRLGVLNADGSVFLRQDFQNLWALQGGRCGLCDTPLRGLKYVAVDHDHQNGKFGPVRAILCSYCNARVTSLNIIWARRVLGYLESPPASRLSKPGQEIPEPLPETPVFSVIVKPPPSFLSRTLPWTETQT